jgi:hypothetical protein
MTDLAIAIANPGSDLPFPTSLPEFMRYFPHDEACGKYLEAIRWPGGFVCPWCHVAGLPYRFAAKPGVLRCKACKRDVGLTAGTVMERSHTPLSTWFLAAYLVSSLTPGMSAVQFQRQLGLGRYETAFQILHKLRAGMVRPDRDRIGGKHPIELPYNAFRSLLGIGGGAESPTYADLYSGEWQHPGSTTASGHG